MRLDMLFFYSKNQALQRGMLYNIITITLLNYTNRFDGGCMKNFFILTDALTYIEENLCDEINQEDIAGACYCSLSALQKLFRYTFHYSLGEYISKRRLTAASREMLETNSNILDIAVKYGYNSAEVFTRAFSKMWHTTPSAYRKTHRFSGLYPRIMFEYNGGSVDMKKHFDISELYDCLRERKGKYIISFDIKGLMPVNENIGRQAGDKVILECLQRIEGVTDENMLLFRIGGDEFVLVTDTDKTDEAVNIAKQVLELNGNKVIHNEAEIPVAMRAGAVRIKPQGTSSIRYGDLFTELEKAARLANDENEDMYVES